MDEAAAPVFRPIYAILAFLALWGAATAYLGATGDDWTFPLVSLGIFGVALPALAWRLTRRADPPPGAIVNPRRETLALLLYLAFYAVVFLGGLFTWLRHVYPEGARQDLLVLGYKLVIHVLLPSLVLLAAGARIAPMWSAGLARRGFWPTLIVFFILLVGLLLVLSPSWSQIAALGRPLPATLGWTAASLVWMSIEAGLCEEYLFRAGLQSRLEAWLRSPVAAILLASVLFALAHAPGLYLRGGGESPSLTSDPIAAGAFTIATLAPVSILFGVLWSRTRSLLLVALLHGAVDMLPNTADMIRHFG